MFLQNRAEWDIDLSRNRFSLEAFVCDIVHIRTSYTKAGREAEGSVRGGGVDYPDGVHTHEIVRAARTRGTEPPRNGGTRVVVLILDFTIPGGIIGVLCLFARLVSIRVVNTSKNLELREDEKVIRCRRDRARGCAIIPPIVRVLGNGLEDGTKRRRNDCNHRPRIARETRPANVCTHLRARPAAGVRSTAVHGEISRRGYVRSVRAIAESNILAAGEGGLC